MKRSDMFNALIKAQDELKKQGKDEWNISALSELTGVSRPTIRKFKDNGHKEQIHILKSLYKQPGAETHHIANNRHQTIIRQTQRIIENRCP